MSRPRSRAPSSPHSAPVRSSDADEALASALQPVMEVPIPMPAHWRSARREKRKVMTVQLQPAFPPGIAEITPFFGGDRGRNGQAPPVTRLNWAQLYSQVES